MSIEELVLHILFVCTGNICRSPTAERLAAAYAMQNGVDDLRASSAGTHALVGHPIHPHAALALEQLGGDPSGFAARRLTSRTTSSADLILAMTIAHRNAVMELAPRKMRSTFTLSEAAQLTSKYGAQDLADLASLRAQVNAHELADIPDPIGEDFGVFAEVASQIAELLLPILAICD